MARAGRTCLPRNGSLWICQGPKLAGAKMDDGGGRARNMAGLLGTPEWGSGRPGLVPSRETTRARWATRP